ncbi:MAG: hypothetical protein NVS3B19_12650 [Ginsengibacter sp.]
MTNKSFEELIKGYVENVLTKEELAHFLQLIKQEQYQGNLQKSIDQLLEKESLSVPVDGNRSDIIFQKIINATKGEKENHIGKVFHFEQRAKLFKLLKVAAAVIILVLSTTMYFYFNKKTENTLARKENKVRPYKKDILPGSNKATLLLADGSTIILDDVKNGALTQQGNSKVVKINGKLAYNSSGSNANEILYNTITTPRGGQYQIELSDGSQVWLNAASSLHFPTAFTGKERKVEIIGEAYFEVAKNKDKPFIVTANGAEVQVLGTHFNVMAYNDEAALKTTLLEGSVKFVNGSTSNILKPGQQSQLTKDGQLKLLSNVDVNAVVAWKNGFFHFENADIETVMKQLSRWYDVELIYQDKAGLDYPNKKVRDLLHADIPRNTKLSDVLKALEIAGGAKFEIEGKKIIIEK